MGFEVVGVKIRVKTRSLHPVGVRDDSFFFVIPNGRFLPEGSGLGFRGIESGGQEQNQGQEQVTPSLCSGYFAILTSLIRDDIIVWFLLLAKR